MSQRFKKLSLLGPWKVATCAFAATLLLLSPQAWAGENYRAEFEGVPAALRDKLGLISELAKGTRALPTTAAIRRTALNDLDEIKRALIAAGYYSASVTYTLEQDPDDAIVRVNFFVQSGPLFKISAYKIVYSDDIADERASSLADLEIVGDGAADGASLQAVQQKFLRRLWEVGYPTAQIVGRHADAKIDEGTAQTVFTFESGPKATFSDLQINGTVRTKSSYLGKLKNWDPGENFDRSKLIDYRNALAATGLFASIDVVPGATAKDGKTPVIVTLEERKRRTVGAGVSFSTSEGPGGRLFLEYRNILGRGENARAEIEANQVEQSIQFAFNKPLPSFPGEVFAQFGFSNETTDAFDARTVDIGAGFAKRWLDDRLTTRAGLSLETSRVVTDNSEERTFFVSAPILAIWDTEDDLLNLSKGARASFSVIPYTGTGNFVRTEFTARSRVNLGIDDKFTLAGRTRLGATFGSSLNDLPFNKRLFAGGGSSVRGFGFQEAGPLDVDGDPIGGRSVIEAAAEARAKITETIQLAAFTDIGNISANAFPEFDGDYFIGIGGGVRYITPVGPIRADFAFPLNKRETDADFQFVISLGQPF